MAVLEGCCICFLGKANSQYFWKRKLLLGKLLSMTFVKIPFAIEMVKVVVHFSFARIAAVTLFFGL